MSYDDYHTSKKGFDMKLWKANGLAKRSVHLPSSGAFWCHWVVVSDMKLLLCITLGILLIGESLPANENTDIRKPSPFNSILCDKEGVLKSLSPESNRADLGFRSLGMLAILVPEELASPQWKAFEEAAWLQGANDLAIKAALADRDSLVREVESHWNGQPPRAFLEEFLSRPAIRWKSAWTFLVLNLEWFYIETTASVGNAIFIPSIFPKWVHVWGLGLGLAVMTGLPIYMLGRMTTRQLTRCFKTL